MESGSSCSLFGGDGLIGFGSLRAFCIWSGLSVLDFGIGLYPSLNCGGGGNMRSLYSLTICLTLLRGLGKGLLILVRGAGIGLYASLNCSRD